MGSIADEMKKVLQMWDEEDQSQQEEIKVETTAEANTKERGSLTNRILAVIGDNPGITGVELRQKLLVLHPDIPSSFTSSMLKQFTDRFYVTRATSSDKVDGRSLYSYTLVPEYKRKDLQRKAKEDHEKAVARAAHARAMKEQKKAMKKMPDTFVPYEKQSISDLVEQYKAVNSKIEQAKPAEWNPNDTIDSLTVKQARALYNALKEVFGG